MTNTRPNVAKNGLYNFKQTAILLEVDRRTIYRWRKLGYLPETKSALFGSNYILGKHILRVFDVLNPS